VGRFSYYDQLGILEARLKDPPIAMNSFKN